MKVTPQIVRACYQLLALTEPFNRWKLPPPEAVKFSVTQHRTKFADWAYDGRHQIRLSIHKHSHLPTALRSMAHEMAHVRVYEVFAAAQEHGPEFKEACRAICKHHPYWDYAEFIL